MTRSCVCIVSQASETYIPLQIAQHFLRFFDIGRAQND